MTILIASLLVFIASFFSVVYQEELCYYFFKKKIGYKTEEKEFYTMDEVDERIHRKRDWRDDIRMWFSILPMRYRDFKYWFIHRTYDRYHIIKCDGLKPGYYDSDTRMLHGVFGLLTDFVECECAWMHRVWNKENPRPWWTKLPFGSHFFRSREDGLAHLEWEKALTFNDEWMDKDDPDYGKPTPQAISATEKMELYLWWRDVRPKRADYIDEYCVLSDRKRDGEKIPEEEFSACSLRCHEIEQAYEKEDTEMLIRVVKVRGSMWS